jgi:adenylate kinase
MTNKLILLGGISAVGKSEICKHLESSYNIKNRRLHNYVINIAKERRIENMLTMWDELAQEAMRIMLRDLERKKTFTCDIHFAVQTQFDTMYALRRDIVEDINEPYIKGIDGDVLKVFGLYELSLYMLLIHTSPEEILIRRIRDSEKGIKKPRSLSSESIRKEDFYETKYFHEIAESLAKYTNPNIHVINNINDRFDRTIEQIVSICNLGDRR